MPKAGDQFKRGRKTYTVIWAAANHVIYVIDGGDRGHLVSMSEWRKMLSAPKSTAQSPGDPRRPPAAPSCGAGGCT